MAEVKQFNKEKKFPIEQELYTRIKSLIHEYDGELGLASALGVLELVKKGITEDV